jgi:acetyl esterase/lipase
MKKIDSTCQQPLTTSFLRANGKDEIGVTVFGQRKKTSAAAALPLIVYFHGGLFNCGTVDDARCLGEELAEGAVIAAVDYPLAPECRFPDTVEIAFDALQWAWQHAADLGGHPGRILVAGDQAGGNLAAAAAMIARDRLPVTRSAKPLAGQILIKPILDPLQATASMRASAECPCRAGWADYLPTIGDAEHPYASPLHSKRLAGLTRALIITTELDPCRDEAQAYADKLAAAGVVVHLRRFEQDGNLVSSAHPYFTPLKAAILEFALEPCTKGAKHRSTPTAPEPEPDAAC